MLTRLATAAALFGLAMGQAQAQYYPPEGGYRPPPPGPGYGYAPPGGQCDAVFRTPYGPRRIVCPMGRPRPVDAPCNCPPGDGYGPPAHGHVVP